MFNIFDLDANDYLKDESGGLILFEDGRNAKDFCEKAQKRLQPRKAKTNINWRAKAQNRFDDKTHTLPDYLKPYALEDHYLHISRESPPLLAYYKDVSKGEQDSFTKISLENYFKNYHEKLSPSERDGIVSRYNKANPIVDGVKFARTPEEIEKVYTDRSQISSCMSGDFKQYPYHPSAAYGNCDLGVAYLTNTRGKVTARTVVWPDKKRYGRIYGDGALATKLGQRGYTKNGFTGAKVRKVRIPLHKDTFLLPYWDHHDGLTNLDDDFFVVSQTGHSWGDSSGIRGRYDTSKLPYCNGCMIYFRGENPPTLTKFKKWKFCDECKKSRFYICARLKKEFYSGESPNTLVNVAGKVEIWSHEAFRQYAFQCQFSGNNYAIEERVRIKRGMDYYWGSQSYADKQGWEYDEKEKIYLYGFKAAKKLKVK